MFDSSLFIFLLIDTVVSLVKKVLFKGDGEQVENISGDLFLFIYTGVPAHCSRLFINFMMLCFINFFV